MADFLTGNGVEAPVTPKSALAPSTSGDLFEGGFKEGWLEKRGAIRKNWKRRYFRLQNNELKYYKRALDKYPNQAPQGEILLEGSSCEFVPEEKYGKKFCFELHTILTKRVYVLVADSGTNMQDWLTEIRKAMLRIRRQKSKQVPSRRVTILLQEQEAEARKRVSNSITERELKSPQPTTVTSPRKSPAPVVSPRHTRSNSASNTGTVLPDGSSIPSDVSVDEKYNMYLEWLQETKSHQRRGTVSERPPAYSMHERLLPDDGRPTSPFYTNCCKYGNCAIL